MDFDHATHIAIEASRDSYIASKEMPWVADMVALNHPARDMNTSVLTTHLFDAMVEIHDLTCSRLTCVAAICESKYDLRQAMEWCLAWDEEKKREGAMRVANMHETSDNESLIRSWDAISVGQWLCTSCTFINSDCTKCEMCGAHDHSQQHIS